MECQYGIKFFDSASSSQVYSIFEHGITAFALSMRKNFDGLSDISDLFDSLLLRKSKTSTGGPNYELQDTFAEMSLQPRNEVKDFVQQLLVDPRFQM